MKDVFNNELILSFLSGLVQGVTEFLPISSTAHLRLLTGFLFDGRDIGISTSNFIQLGTLLAILHFFWPDLKTYFKRIWQVIKHPKKLGIFVHNFKFWFLGKKKFRGEKEDIETDIVLSQLIVGTLPVFTVSAVFYTAIGGVLRTMEVIGWSLIVGAVLLYIAERFAKKTKLKNHKHFNLKEVLIVGGFQALSVIPGMSRSGSALTGALFMGENRKRSVRFSFLLGLPILLLAGLKGFYDFATNSEHLSLLPHPSNWTDKNIWFSFAGLIFAFGFSYYFGLMFLRWLLNYLSNNSSRWFILYRILFGGLLLGLVYSGVI